MKKTSDFTPRTVFTIKVAAAISGNDPWAKGYREYRGTYRTLYESMPSINRDHGGNAVIEWSCRGEIIEDTGNPWVKPVLDRGVNLNKSWYCDNYYATGNR